MSGNRHALLFALCPCRISPTDPRADSDEEHGNEEHIPQGSGQEEDEGIEQGGDGGSESHTAHRTHILPELEDHHADTIESTPDDEIEAGTMPETSQKHGDHGVEVGVDLLTLLGMTDGGVNHQGRYHSHSQGNPQITAEDEGCTSEQADPETGAKGDVAIASEGDIEIGLQPARKGDVPAFPEVATVLCLVGRIEVGWQMEAHEQGEADGNIGVAGEIGIDLQGVGEERHEVLETREELGIVEDTVDEVDRKIVTQDDLLGQTIENPEDGNAEHTAREEILAIELGNEITGLDDGACHQLGEEADIEAKIEPVANGLDEALINIASVTDGLEGEEGDTYGQDDAINTEDSMVQEVVAHLGHHVIDLEMSTQDVVHHIGEEVGILEITEYAEVYGDAEREPCTTFPSSGATVNGLGNEEIAAGDEYQQSDEKATGLVIEQQTDEEEVAVAQEMAIAGQGEERKDNGEERPEMELGEQ